MHLAFNRRKQELPQVSCTSQMGSAVTDAAEGERAQPEASLTLQGCI